MLRGENVAVEEDRSYCVYVHTNKINGKKYVGQTGRKPEIRWGSNGVNYKASPYFYSAIQKYGWDNFDHEIIANNLTKQEACDLEIKFIKELDTMNEANGYNLTEGGEGAKHSERTRKKISELRKGIVFSEEHLKNLTEAIRNRNYTPSEETRKKISERASVSVSQYSKDGVLLKTWKSMTEVENALNICYQHISDCCNDIRKSAGGFIWRYANKPLTKEHLEWCNQKQHARIRKVDQYNKDGIFIKTWGSIKQAAKELSITEQHISGCCRGKRKTAGGFIWKYADENKAIFISDFF